MAVRACSIREAIAFGPADRHVVRAPASNLETERSHDRGLSRRNLCPTLRRHGDQPWPARRAACADHGRGTWHRRRDRSHVPARGRRTRPGGRGCRSPGRRRRRARRHGVRRAIWPTPTQRSRWSVERSTSSAASTILVNNAGILKMAPLLDITVDDWDLTFDVNVRAMLVTIQVAGKAMIPNGRGSDRQHGQHGRQGRFARTRRTTPRRRRRSSASHRWRRWNSVRTASRSTASVPATC